MSELNKAWIAGFIDADGCISTTGARGANIKVSAVNTYRPVLSALEAMYGGKVSENGNRRHNPNARACYQWQLTRIDRIRYFLNDILPYLQIKQAQAELALQLLDLVPTHGYGKPLTPEVWGHRLVLADNIRELNQRKE